MNYATVNPGNTADIADVDLNGRRMVDFSNVRIPDYAGGERSFTINNGAVPEWALFDMEIVDPGYPGEPNYYTNSASLEFLTSPDRVRKTISYAQIPLDDLYAEKRVEVAQQDQTVRYNAVDTSLSVNWWIVVTQDMRFEILGVNGNWVQRQIDGQGWPGGVNQPWIGIYNAANERSRREQVPNSTTWETAFTEITQHDQATGNATNASLNALDIDYDAAVAALAAAGGDETDPAYIAAWQVVADHDAADPTWGYPPTVSLSADARSLFGG